MIICENVRILRNKSHASAMRIEWIKIKKVYVSKTMGIYLHKIPEK